MIQLQLTHGFQTPMTGKIHTLTWRVILGKLFNFGPFGNFQPVAETYIREGEPIIALTIPRLPSATQFLLATCPLEGFATAILPNTHYFGVITAILVVFEAISTPMWSRTLPMGMSQAGIGSPLQAAGWSALLWALPHKYRFRQQVGNFQMVQH